jgi:hypothetical protein
MGDDQQMIKRRVFTDKNELLREGLVPLSIPNKREALMAYWQESDAAIAAEEAAAAQAEMDRIAAMEQTPPEVSGAMALAAIQGQVEELIAQIGQLKGLAMATPDEVLRGASQIARVAGLAAEIEASATTAIAQVDGVSAVAQVRLAELDGQLAIVVATAGQVVADCRQMVESNNALMVAKTTEAISKRIIGLEVHAAQLRGPKGYTGNPGTSTTVGAGRPEGVDAMLPLIERPAIKGDIYIDGNDDNRRAYRWTGNVWEPGCAMATIQVRDVKVSALDASVKSTTMVTNLSGGGGGGERLVNPLLTNSGGVVIADTSNWATTTQDPTSALLILDLVAVDGTMSGKHGFSTFNVTGDGLLGQETEYGCIGDLEKFVRVSISVDRGPAAVPTGYTATLPPGKTATRLVAKIVSNLAGTTTQYLVNGAVMWAMKPLGAFAAPGTPTESPAWVWQ